MSKLGTQTVVDLAPGDNPDHILYSIRPASDSAVEMVLGYDPDLGDGLTRSEWLWITMPNGDVILGVFPQDEGYFALETEHSA